MMLNKNSTKQILFQMPYVSISSKLMLPLRFHLSPGRDEMLVSGPYGIKTLIYIDTIADPRIKHVCRYPYPA